MNILKVSLLSLALLALSTPSFSAEKPWREINSPHFRMITNGTDNQARHVARAFEQMRAVFASQFPGFRLDAAQPVLIVAPEDENSARKLLPDFWKFKGPKPAGVYFQSWEQPYVMVRLDAVQNDDLSSDQFAVVYHEYVHSILHLNLHWLPTWLDEGMAEYYAYTRFQGKYAFIGAPPRNMMHLSLLRYRPSIPLAKFLDQRGAFTHSEEDTELYYAQCWALTHYLTMAPGMELGDRLNKFFRAIQAGTEQKKSFQDTFGDFAQVQQDFDQYVRHFTFLSKQVLAPARIEDKDFITRSLTLAETEAEMASFYASTHQWKLAREASEFAEKNDPKLALAHQEMGFVLLQEGKDEQATQELSHAIELDQSLYRALFAKTMLSSLPHSANPADRVEFRTQLSNVAKINPQFAPAYVELAKLDVAMGMPDIALGPALKAEQLEPWRAGYHLLTGQILLRLNRVLKAANHASYVADHWVAPDHDEAMELWSEIPAEKRPANAPTDPPLEKDVSRAEGLVKSVDCRDDKTTIVLERAGQPPLTFNIHHSSGGFSDTLWVGEDHFTPCYHTLGLRAVIFYKPATDKAYSGDAVLYGFRDDLAPLKATGQPAAGGN